MRAKIASVIVISMLFGTQSHAQGFLENLGRNIEQGIKKEVSKKINQELKNLKENLSKNNNSSKDQSDKLNSSNSQNSQNSENTKPAATTIRTAATTLPGAPGKEVDSPFVFAGGSGTIEDPYLVQTAEHLNAIRKGLQNHYRLIADIDLSDWGNWIPIGGTSAYGFMGAGPNKADEGAESFQGSLDGNGHVISGMQIVIHEETPYLTESGNWRAYGLFASLATNPENHKIQNLGVVDFRIDINYTNVKKNLNLYAGAICGGMNNGTDIVNCYSKGGEIRIMVTGNEAFQEIDSFGLRPRGAPQITVNAGGICSQGGGTFSKKIRSKYMHIERCINASPISVDVQNGEFTIRAGGIIAAMNTSHIHECYNCGNISIPLGLDNIMGVWNNSLAAGICAFAAIPDIPGIYHKPPEGASFIQNCYNTGHISGRGAAGIFHYSASDIHLENCYNTGHITGNESDIANGIPTIGSIFSDICGIKPFGSEFVRKCYSDPNSVSGPAWKSSNALGRKVLVSIPEDEHPSNVYNIVPAQIGSLIDVNANDWYADAVKWALDRNILSGTAFYPDKTCTRAELITFLWRAAGAPEMLAANPFSDVKATDEYYHAAIWASEKGMVSGSSFAAGTSCTREELILCLWKNAGCPETVQANQFLDIADMQSELGKAVSWGYINCIMSSTEKYKFAGKKSCTKAQALTYINRAIK